MTPSDHEQAAGIMAHRRPRSHWAKYAVWGAVGVTAVICGYRLLYQFTPAALAKTGTEAIGQLGRDGVQMAARLWDKWDAFIHHQTTATSSVVEVGRTLSTEKSGPLIVAVHEFVLQFPLINNRVFGTTTAEVRVSATAHYFVPLLGPADGWKIEVSEKDGVRVCVIHAPRPRALTPVTFDSRTIDLKVETGWLRFNREEMRDAAIAEITPRLDAQAQALATEVTAEARKTIATFVKTWLLNANEWGSQKINAIQVLFPDESAKDVDFSIPRFHE
jgi:hypothetical protein